jgi:hypothetical protein
MAQKRNLAPIGKQVVSQFIFQSANIQNFHKKSNDIKDAFSIVAHINIFL